MSISRMEVWLRGLEITYRSEEAKMLAQGDEADGYSTVDLADGADMFLHAFELHWEEGLPGEWTERTT